MVCDSDVCGTGDVTKTPLFLPGSLREASGAPKPHTWAMRGSKGVKTVNIRYSPWVGTKVVMRPSEVKWKLPRNRWALESHKRLDRIEMLLETQSNVNPICQGIRHTTGPGAKSTIFFFFFLVLKHYNWNLFNPPLEHYYRHHYEINWFTRQSHKRSSRLGITNISKTLLHIGIKLNNKLVMYLI